MTIAAFFLGLLIATIPAFIWHFLSGGTFKHLILLIILSWVGFWLGHLFALWRNWSFIKLGPIYLGTALIFSIAFVIGGSWLSSYSLDQFNKRS
jgi:hypothetical protein